MSSDIDDNITIVETEEEVNPREIELEGILLGEELMTIINICKYDTVKEDRCLPLVINFQGNRRFVGNFELTFNNLVKLNFISEDYTLKLIDNENKREAIIFSKDNKDNGESLFKLINLV